MRRLCQLKIWLSLLGLVTAGVLLSGQRVGAQMTVVVSTNSVWKYLDDGSDQGEIWTDPYFDGDELWKQGPAKLGYGNGDEATVVSYGSNIGFKFITTYFRHAFQVTNATSVTNLKARILRQDGAVVYINGVEVFRSNMPDDVIDWLTLATQEVTGIDASTFYQFAVDPLFLFDGYNLVAVEVHLAGSVSPALGFDLELLAETGPPPPPQPLGLTRGPYHQ